jgi:hypothetical protein
MWKDTTMLIRRVWQWKIIFCRVIKFPVDMFVWFFLMDHHQNHFFSLSFLEIFAWQLKSQDNPFSWRYFNINIHSLDLLFFSLILLYVFILFFFFILQSTFFLFFFFIFRLSSFFFPSFLSNLFYKLLIVFNLII